MTDLQRKPYPERTRFLFGFLLLVNLALLAYMVYSLRRDVDAIPRDSSLQAMLAVFCAAPLVAGIGLLGARRRWHPALLVVAGILSAGWPAFVGLMIAAWPKC
jgi:hypothetical protein